MMVSGKVRPRCFLDKLTGNEFSEQPFDVRMIFQDSRKGSDLPAPNQSGPDQRDLDEKSVSVEKKRSITAR